MRRFTGTFGWKDWPTAPMRSPARAKPRKSGRSRLSPSGWPPVMWSARSAASVWSASPASTSRPGRSIRIRACCGACMCVRAIAAWASAGCWSRQLSNTHEGGVELLQLVVISDNLAARRLYEGLGFVEYGVEWHATKYRGRYHDDMLMVLPLRARVRSGGDLCADRGTVHGMIPRYSRPQMAAIWEPENYFRIQMEIEALPAKRRRSSASSPRASPRRCASAASSRSSASDEIEREVHHETIAFLTNLAEHVGPEARFVAPGHDFERRARHLPRGAADAGEPTSCSPISTRCWPRSSGAPSSTS